VRFWQRVDPTTVTVAPYPPLDSPRSSLEAWQQGRDEFPDQSPRLLFPFAYQSRRFLLIEMEDGSGPGGTVIEWFIEGDPFTIRFPALSAYLDLLATMIELGEFVAQGGPNPTRFDFDPEHRWPDAQAVRLAAAQPLPRLGASRIIEGDARSWPEHWLASNGLTVEERAPRGATTTVAALLQAAEEGRTASGTIRATVTRLAMSGEGCRTAVDDGTGALDLWCPTAVCTYGPIIRREFEIDVVVRANPESPPDWRAEHREVQDRVLEGDPDNAQQAIMRMHERAFKTPAAAEATAIRPLD